VGISVFTSKAFLMYKITNIIDTNSGTGLSRVLTWDIAFNNIKNNFFFGTGTYSFATIAGKGAYGWQTNAWIGNFFITILNDYGITGFLLFSLFFSSLVFKSLKMIKTKYKNIQSQDKWILLALCLSSISIYIAFYFATGFALIYSWSFLGLIPVVIRKLNKEIIL
jgi:O-antigen ligase